MNWTMQLQQQVGSVMQDVTLSGVMWITSACAPVDVWCSKQGLIHREVLMTVRA